MPSRGYIVRLHLDAQVCQGSILVFEDIGHNNCFATGPLKACRCIDGEHKLKFCARVQQLQVRKLNGTCLRLVTPQEDVCLLRLSCLNTDDHSVSRNQIASFVHELQDRLRHDFATICLTRLAEDDHVNCTPRHDLKGVRSR